MCSFPWFFSFCLDRDIPVHCPRPLAACCCKISIFLKASLFRKRPTLNLQPVRALSSPPGPSASWAADRERERVPKRDWNYNRLACIFVPLHDHSERRYLKIAPVIYITLSAVLSRLGLGEEPSRGWVGLLVVREGKLDVGGVWSGCSSLAPILPSNPPTLMRRNDAGAPPARCTSSLHRLRPFRRPWELRPIP